MSPPDLPPETAAALASLKAVVFDFDGVMTDNRVVVLDDGREAVMCNRSDGLGLGMLKSLGLHLLILSKETNPVVSMRAEKLGLPCAQAVDDKAAFLKSYMQRHGLTPEQVAYLANDINDAECLRMVGLPVVVADAWPEVKPLAKLVLTRNGGMGAVREFCDLVCAARQGTLK